MQLKFPKFLLANTEWLESKQNSILSAAVIITVANIISALAGLLRQRLLLDYFFHTQSSREAFEALLVAFQIPDMMFQLIILGAISAAFIPIFTSMRKQDEQSAFEMSAITMNLLLLIFVLISVVVFIFAVPITDLRTGQAFNQAQIQIAANLTRLMLLQVFFFAISNFLSGMLQSYQRFVIPSLAPIFYNVGILLGVYLFANQLGIYSAGVGVILGAILHMAIQLPLTYKLGFRFKFSLNYRYPGIKQLLKLTPARFLTLGASELENLALAFFATSVGNLSFVVVRLATTLMTIPIRLFGVPIGQASLPFLSDESDEQDLVRFSKLVIQSLHQITFLALPASILLLILRIPIVRIAFGTQDFPWETTVTTGLVVALLATSIVPQAMTQLLVRAFYALKDTKTPLYTTILTVILNIFIYYVAADWVHWGVVGISSGITLAAVAETILLLVFLDRRVEILRQKAFWLPQVKMLSASFLMAVFLYLPFKILDNIVFNTSRTVELVALTISTATIGMLVYLFFSALFDVRELQYLTRLLSSFDPRQKLFGKTETVLETPIEGDEV